MFVSCTHFSLLFSLLKLKPITSKHNWSQKCMNFSILRKQNRLYFQVPTHKFLREMLPFSFCEMINPCAYKGSNWRNYTCAYFTKAMCVFHIQSWLFSAYSGVWQTAIICNMYTSCLDLRHLSWINMPIPLILPCPGENSQSSTPKNSCSRVWNCWLDSPGSAYMKMFICWHFPILLISGSDMQKIKEETEPGDWGSEGGRWVVEGPA